MTKYIILKNKKKVKKIETLPHFITRDIQYLIEDENGDRFIISQQALEQLLPKSELTKSEKIQLFLTYFQGRKDVYAKRWVTSDGRKGYVPHCRHEWTYQCPKKTQNNPRYDCNHCKQRQLIPYDENTVLSHIQNGQKDFYGIYPMLDGDKTQLLVLDFDKASALSEVEVVIKSAQKYQIDLLIERSQSGQGIHLWLFFSEAIPAHAARKLGHLLLLDTTNHSAINLMSYDRMIPMQDSLPKGALGNLIALPLKAENIREGKSTFLDENLNLVPSQYLWQHLSTIHQYSLLEVNDLIIQLESENPVQTYSRDLVKNSSKVTYPKKIRLEKSGELKILKDNLTRKEQIALMFLATFKNPEYYKRQKARMTTWDTPRLVMSAREDEESIYLPRGLEETLKGYVSEVSILDLQTEGGEILAAFTGTLYPEQEAALSRVLKHSVGILCARTGFGKTILAADLIARRKVSTLILVQNQNLAEQWQSQLLQFLDIQTAPFIEKTPKGRLKKKPKVGIISGQKIQQTKVVDVAMIQKLARFSQETLVQFLSNYGQVIIDECHHIAAQSFENVIRASPAKYLLGLSATPDREDGLTPINLMRLGDVIFESKKIDQSNVLMKNYLYPRYTSIGEIDKKFEQDSYAEQLNFLSRSKERNKQIVADIQSNYLSGRTCLILSERLEHLRLLQEMLAKDVLLFVLSGNQTKKKNQEVILKLRKETRPFILLATSKLVGEGFDLPQLDTLFLTLPFKAKGSHKQYLGRLQRDLEHKNELRVYDYVDISSGLFAMMYQKRLKVYRDQKYELAEDDATRQYQSQLFNVSDYEKQFLNDLKQVKFKAIFFVSVLSQNLCNRLGDLATQGIAIFVVTQNDKQLNEHLQRHQVQQILNLKEKGVQIKLLDIISQNIAIFDDCNCWYGNLNFLSQSKREKTTLRFVSEAIAQELLKVYR